MKKTERTVIIMQRTLICSAIMVVLLLAGGCSSNSFMVYKDAKNFNITSTCPELKQLLCDSGDVDRVVRDSELPAPLQKTLKVDLCAFDKDKDGLKSTLDRMTKEQRAALKDAFRKNGYDINKPADS